MKKLWGLALCLLLSGWAWGDAGYRVETFPGKVKVLVDLGGFATDATDILFVIDNSGSMHKYQNTVMQTAPRFFAALKSVRSNWKLGLISTSKGEPPYVGFASPLDSLTPNADWVFGEAVGRLGTQGDPNEKTFEPILDALTQYPQFLRPNAALAIVLVSDAPEQSAISAQDFVKALNNRGVDSTRISFYGFINPKEWCSANDDEFTYAGSAFEQLLGLVQGECKKICVNDA